jgi:hypothetical protein
MAGRPWSAAARGAAAGAVRQTCIRSWGASARGRGARWTAPSQVRRPSAPGLARWWGAQTPCSGRCARTECVGVVRPDVHECIYWGALIVKALAAVPLPVILQSLASCWGSGERGAGGGQAAALGVAGGVSREGRARPLNLAPAGRLNQQATAAPVGPGPHSRGHITSPSFTHRSERVVDVDGGGLAVAV